MTLLAAIAFTKYFCGDAIVNFSFFHTPRLRKSKWFHEKFQFHEIFAGIAFAAGYVGPNSIFGDPLKLNNRPFNVMISDQFTTFVIGRFFFQFFNLQWLTERRSSAVEEFY